jgi:MFS family permease
VKPTALTPLRSRTFRALFASSVTSTLGDWLDFVAVVVLVAVVWQRGPFGLAVVSVAVAAPYVLAPLLGVLVDRWPPRPVLVGADLARAALTVGIVFVPGLWELAVLLALRSSCAVVFGPAAASVLSRTVPTRNLLPANAAMQTAMQGLKVVGPALGGGLLVVLSPTALIGLNAVTFAVSAVILLAVRVPRQASAHSQHAYLRELREGLAFVRREPALRLTVVALGATVLLSLLFDSMLPLAVADLGLRPGYFGYFIAAIGLGGVAGAAALARWGAGARPFVLIAAGQLVTGAMVALTGAAVLAGARLPGAVWPGVGLVIGAAGAGVLVGFPTVVQTVTPHRLIGRVWTAIVVVPAVLGVAGPAIGAAVLARTSVGWLFATGGLALVLLALGTFARQRGLRVQPAEPTEPAVPTELAVPTEPAVPIEPAPESPGTGRRRDERSAPAPWSPAQTRVIEGR